jgi:hypothetical protein
LKNPEVELKLFLIKLVNCLHVLHALFKDLHFLLKLDFRFCLVVGISVSDVFQLLLVRLLGPLPLLLVLILSLFLFLEQLINFLLVSLQDLAAFVLECLLDFAYASVVSSPERLVLRLHVGDQSVDIVIHA